MNLHIEVKIYNIYINNISDEWEYEKCIDGKVGHFTSESIDKIIEVSTLGILLCQIGFALISKGPFNKFIFLSWWYQENTFLKFWNQCD